jgi:glycine/D-amino acid oxidase-like deaminating enzyme
MSVVVVGGGVLGFMHALEARRRGHPVTHLEREPGSRGASVRNFGLIWVSGRAGGPELDLARRARVRWAEIAAEVPGTGFRPNGSLTLARDDAELELLKEAAARPDADLRDYELLDPAAVRVVNPALRKRGFSREGWRSARRTLGKRPPPSPSRDHAVTWAPGA